MMSVFHKKLQQRGAALIEYAILLSFIGIIAVCFLGSGSMAKPINNIVRNINNMLTSDDQDTSLTGSEGSMGTLLKTIRK